MASVANARRDLAEAQSRRATEESAVDQAWQDEARRRFVGRILTPLDQERGRIEQAMADLDAELARALIELES